MSSKKKRISIEIGDKFRCIKKNMYYYNYNEIYTCHVDNAITDKFNNQKHWWRNGWQGKFERV